jgi:hypothetical protein
MSVDEAQPQEDKIFRTELLNDVLDYEIMSLDSRLELLIVLRIPLVFVCDIKKVASLSIADVTKLCSNLELASRNDGSCPVIDETNPVRES